MQLWVPQFYIVYFAVQCSNEQTRQNKNIKAHTHTHAHTHKHIQITSYTVSSNRKLWVH